MGWNDPLNDTFNTKPSTVPNQPSPISSPIHGTESPLVSSSRSAGSKSRRSPSRTSTCFKTKPVQLQLLPTPLNSSQKTNIRSPEADIRGHEADIRSPEADYFAFVKKRQFLVTKEQMKTEKLKQKVLDKKNLLLTLQLRRNKAELEGFMSKEVLQNLLRVDQ